MTSIQLINAALNFDGMDNAIQDDARYINLKTEVVNLKIKNAALYVLLSTYIKDINPEKYDSDGIAEDYRKIIATIQEEESMAAEIKELKEQQQIVTETVELKHLLSKMYSNSLTEEEQKRLDELMDKFDPDKVKGE